MQGDAGEAEGKAQPVQEADLIPQQVSSQQQSADFLRAEAERGSDQEEELAPVQGVWTAGAPGTTTGEGLTCRNSWGLGGLASGAERGLP